MRVDVTEVIKTGSGQAHNVMSEPIDVLRAEKMSLQVSISADPAYNIDMTQPTTVADNVSADDSGVIDVDVARHPTEDKAIAVWVQNNGPSNNNKNALYISEATDGFWTNSGDRFQIGEFISPPEVDVTNVTVAYSANGDIVIAYLGTAGAEKRVYVSRKTGDTWIHPTSYTDAITAWTTCRSPMCRINSTGKIAVAYTRGFAGDTEFLLNVAQYDPSAQTPEWINEELSVPTDGEYKVWPAVDINDSGVVAVAAYDASAETFTPYTYELADEGFAWTAHGVSSVYVPANIQPQLVLTNEGNIVAGLVGQADSGNHRLFLTERMNGAWNYIFGSADYFQDVAVDMDCKSFSIAKTTQGKIFLATEHWWNFAGHNHNVKLYRKDIENGDWNIIYEDNLNTEVVTKHNVEIAAIDNASVAFFVYMVYLDDTGLGLVATLLRRVVGNGYYALQQLSIDSTNSSDPNIALSVDGTASATWIQSDGVNDQTFVSSGIKVTPGTEFVGDGPSIKLYKSNDGVNYVEAADGVGIEMPATGSSSTMNFENTELSFAWLKVGLEYVNTRNADISCTICTKGGA